MLFVFDYGHKGTAFFLITKFFLTFFTFFHLLKTYLYMQVFSCCSWLLPFRLWSCVLLVCPLVCWSWACVLMTIYPQSDARAYARVHTRTGIFRP